MNTQQQDELSRVRDIIRKIEDKSASGDYIFRGEPECYPKVASTLYRQYQHILDDGFNVEVVQNKMLDRVKEHLPDLLTQVEWRPHTAPISDLDFEILTEIQHYGGKTNLIDFTTDSRIALFFACDGSPGRDGRVLLKKRGDIGRLDRNPPREPSKPLNRVIAQKVIFVQPRQGFIEFDSEENVVMIPAAIKNPTLEYLQKYHNISAKTIYNDLHGFIRIQDIHHRAGEELYKGFISQNEAHSASSPEERDKWNRKAIEYYTQFLRLQPDPDYVEIYNNRGVAYFTNGEVDKAIEDYDKAIERKPDYAGAYCYRGFALLHKGEWDKAKADLTVARNLGLDIIASFQSDYENVADFEQKNDVQVPPDLAEMLTPA